MFPTDHDNDDDNSFSKGHSGLASGKIVLNAILAMTFVTSNDWTMDLLDFVETRQRGQRGVRINDDFRHKVMLVRLPKFFILVISNYFVRSIKVIFQRHINNSHKSNTFHPFEWLYRNSFLFTFYQNCVFNIKLIFSQVFFPTCTQLIVDRKSNKSLKKKKTLPSISGIEVENLIWKQASFRHW